MGDLINNIEIIIVNPKNNGNLGSVCRAMKTMGITSLCVVGKNDFIDIDSEIMAVHASDILHNAKSADTLKDAVSGSGLVAGITRRRGKRRKYFSISPEELADKISSYKSRISLVFGNEEAGLSDSDLSFCNISVYIPSSNIFHSLNLSHAVQIICYSIFRKFNQRQFPDYPSVAGEELQDLVSVIISSLSNIGFFKQVDSGDMEVFFRDILSRAGLSAGEYKRLKAVFKKISGLIAGI